MKKLKVKQQMTLPTLQPPNPERWFKYFMMAILVVMALVMLSCDCNYHLSKIKKKCGQHALFDTIRIHDTLFVKESRVDTLFKWTKTSDTIRLNNDRLHVKYYYNFHDSTVYLAGKCDSLTIYKDKLIYVEKNIFEFDYIAKYKWYIIIPIILIVLAFVSKKLLS